jgi:hypothetical protein
MNLLELKEKQIQVCVNEFGTLLIKDIKGNNFEVGLLPLEMGFEHAYPYVNLEPREFKIPAWKPENRFNMLSENWNINQEDGKIKAEKLYGDLKLWSVISIEDGACIIESFMEKPSHSATPANIAVIKLDNYYLSDSKLFTTRGIKGSIKIDSSANFNHGEFSKILFGIQKRDSGILINSEVGSNRTLHMGKLIEKWYGMVPLPPMPETCPISLGKIEIRTGNCIQTMLEEFGSRTAGNFKIKEYPRSWNSWDYYHSSISHDKVMENVHAI